MVKLFDTPNELCSLKAFFYSCSQFQYENIRSFMARLWKLAQYAFDFNMDDRYSFDHIVLQQFIHGLHNPHLRNSLRVSKPTTTSEAVDRAV